MKHFYAIVFFFAMAFSAGVQAQSVPDTVGSTGSYYCDFEDSVECSAWTILNGTMANGWYIGTAANYTNNGNRSLYVSSDGGATRSYNPNSTSTVYAYRELYFEAGYYTFFYNWTCSGEWYDYALVALVPATVQFTPDMELMPGVGVDSLPEGWINLGREGSDINLYGAPNWWTSTSGKLSVTTPGVYRLVYIWHNDYYDDYNPPIAIDDINIVWQTCPWVRNLRVAATTDSSITLAWTPGGSETHWYVDCNSWEQADDTIYTIEGLYNGTNYWINVYPYCPEYGQGYYTNIVASTDCGTFPVPYEADFPRGNNSGFDNCWYKGGTHYNRPYLAHYSAYGGNVLNLESEYGLYDSSYSYLAMPIMREPLDSLYLRCTFGNRENTMTVTSAVAVGVMSDPEDFSTFVGIDTIDLHDYDTYSTYYYEKNLAGYGQYGSHVAFVAITPQLYGDTYTQNYVLISKVSLMKANNCSFIDRLRVNPGATSITVDWIDRGNASSWLVEIPEYYPCTDTTISIVVQDTHVVIEGLRPASDGVLHIRALCSESDTGEVIERWVTTLCNPIQHSELPYTTSFEDLSRDVNGNLNYCWRSRSSNSSLYFADFPQPYSSYARSGNIALAFQQDDGRYCYAVLPQFEDSLNHLAMDFYVKSINPGNNPVLVVGVMSDPDDIATFDTVATFAPGSDYRLCQVSFDSFAVTGHYIALLCYCEYYSTVLVDDLEVRENDPCNKPFTTSAVVSGDSVEINWAYDGTATHFEVAWDYDDFDPNNAVNIDTVTGNSLMLDGSTSPTHKIVAYSRPLCSSGVVWQGPVTANIGFNALQNNQTTTVKGCHFTIYDDGMDDNYSNSFDGGVVLLPPDSTYTFVVSGIYNTERNYDRIYLYDGNSTSDPLITMYEGEGTFDNILTNGPLTIFFHSDGSVSYSGFEIYVDCVGGSVCPPVTKVNVDEVSTASALINWTMPPYDNDSVLVRWTDTVGNTDSSYATTKPFVLTNLGVGTVYTVSVASICNGTITEYAYADFATLDYDCAEYDSASSFFDTVWDIYNSYTSNYIPGYSYYNYSYSQQLFLRSELDTGLIMTMSLMPSFINDPHRTYEIFLAQTDDTILTHFLYPQGMTKVYDGGEIELVPNEWIDFELTTPYHYDGQGNLLVTFRDVTGFYIGSNGWYCHYAEQRSIYAYRDGSTYPIDNSEHQDFTTYNYSNNIIFSNKTCVAPETCSAPIVKATEVADDHISILWLPDSCAHNWNVEHRMQGEELWIADLTATTQSSYTFGNLLPYTYYEIRVKSNGDDHYTTTLLVRTECSVISVPYFEDFNNFQNYDGPMPVCWHWGAEQNYPCVNSDGLRGSCLYHYSNRTNEYFTLPKLDAPMDTLTLSFAFNGSSSSLMDVGVMADPTDIRTFRRVGSAKGDANQEWKYYEFSLAGMDDGYIAFVVRNRYSYLRMDLIEVQYNTNCRRPNDVHAANKTATTAAIEWTSTGATEYIVQYAEISQPMDSLRTIVTQAPSVALTGLSGNYGYRVIVRSVCAAGDTSSGSMDYIFYTGCSIKDVPFTETFEDYNYGTSYHAPTCWYYGSYHDNYPFISRSYNHTANGSKSMYMYCYDKDGEGHKTYLTLPEIELDTLTMSDLQAVFYGYAQGTTSRHQLIVGVCDTANMLSSFTPVDTVVMEPGHWQVYEVTFDSYTGTGKYITFVSSVAPGNKYSYPYLDDLTIEPIPPCQRPNNLYANEESATANTIEIGWNDRSGATQWIVEYGDKGFTPGTGTQVVANSNPFTLTGIHRGYEGEFYVKAVCSSESSSDWSRRPCQFKTVCDTMSDVIVACDSYTWHGTTYNSSITGPLYDAPDIPSCDSLVVLHLTVKHSTEGTETLSACDSYTWYGNTYTASTTAPTHHLTNAVGCDSTAHLSLTIRYSTEGTESHTACDNYTWYGNTYTASTTAPTHLLTNAVGCDSTAHLNLTMKYSTTATEQVVTCDRSSYTWRGQTFTESTNSATYTLPNTVGCDSVITLHLNMSHSDTGIETVDVCDSYTWHGNTYTVSTNTATYETNTVAGCDSTVTLHLTVRYSNAANFSDIACDSYSWHGNTYTASTTTPTYTSTNIAGCDSTTTLLLTILNSTSSNEIVSACDSYQWHGTTYTASTSSPTFITTNAVGCDSVIHLNLTVRYSSEGTLTLTACDSYTWHGTTYTASTNTPTWLTLNNAGCDSLVTLNLAVNYSNTGIDNQTACDSYTWHGNTYTASTNTPTYLSTNNMGCDSTTTLHLTVNYSNSGIETVSECDSYLWHGTVYTASTNTPTFMSTNAAGCDSTTTLHLTMNYSSSSIDNVTACDSYRWHGVDYTTSTSTPTFATSNAVGCDSTVVLHLTVNYSNTGIDNLTACDSYTWHGVVYTTSVDTATFVETNAAGCDSTVTLHLTVNYSTTGSESATACDSYTWHGSTYTTSGTPTYQETNAAGCDSTITLNLTINQSTSSSESATACDSYTWHGSTYTTSGTPTHQETNAAGCDSTITLTLTINYSSTGSESATACDSLLWHGNTYTTSGNPTYLTTNAAGCDSTVTLNLTINYSSTGSESATACDSYTWNNVTYAESGEYSYQTTNAAGCDSTVTLTLTINISSQTEIADTATGSYQWNGETYTESGTYTWTGTNAAGCDSTVTLHLFIQEVGINTIDGTNAINVYPNPTSGLLNIDAEGLTAIEVYDINGRVVATYGAENKINIASLPAGAYTLRIQTQQGNHIRRIILK